VGVGAFTTTESACIEYGKGKSVAKNISAEKARLEQPLATSYRPEFQSVADSSAYLLVISDQYFGVISPFARKEFRIRD
jgi:hypothetical protein